MKNLGISLKGAYKVVAKLKQNCVIVAVLDDGVDIRHEDLLERIWINHREIPNNNIDDDDNGYIDDVNGWNFLGNANGGNLLANMTYEEDLFYHKYKDSLSDSRIIRRIHDTLVYDEKNARESLILFEGILEKVLWADSIIKSKYSFYEFSLNELSRISSSEEVIQKAKVALMASFNQFAKYANTNVELIEYCKNYTKFLKIKSNVLSVPPPDFRFAIVQDNCFDISERFYGNNNVSVGKPLHGTHVAGIIAAERNNFIGMDGILDSVLIMPVRVAPTIGSLYSKDLALGIKYAVDNGAKIISLSLRQSFSIQQKWIDDAIKYAQKKNVLIVHAAGNDAKNLDYNDEFPKPTNNNCENWITVGASTMFSWNGYIAEFSNYGRNSVDLFAPGVNIYSTIPERNCYRELNGTSHAAPVVAGVAALLLSYFPNLTPKELKEILLYSVYIPSSDVNVPGTGQRTKMENICVSGGIVNAFGAILVAKRIDFMRKDRKGEKSSIKNLLKNYKEL